MCRAYASRGCGVPQKVIERLCGATLCAMRFVSKFFDDSGPGFGVFRAQGVMGFARESMTGGVLGRDCLAGVGPRTAGADWVIHCSLLGILT